MPDRQPPAATIELFHRINERLELAVFAARAAKSSADADDIPRALAMLHDAEPLLFEVMTLLNAASLLRDNHER
jgi:hypothetical protein